jgi:primosomal replication protein N
VIIIVSLLTPAPEQEDPGTSTCAGDVLVEHVRYPNLRRVVNQLRLSAVVVQVQSLRYTPAGIPAVNMVLEHESTVTELDQPRQVKLQLRAVAFGAQAETLARTGLDTRLALQGFLANARNGKGVVFHIQDFSKT